MLENPTVRFHLRSGATIDVEDDTIEDIADVIGRIQGGAPHYVQFGDAIILNYGILAAELL